ncbi:MAG: NAD-dependent malic enzyme [Burkholderiales bacterium]|nr:NAD-dependent malic enzyme [Burkholderiales bacterium]
MPQPDLSGVQILRNPFFNQGTAFTKEARKKLHLEGLLPPRVQTIALQAKRMMDRIRGVENPLTKYEIMDSLRSRNRTLYFYLLVNHIEELLPIVYTPTVGKACMDFDHIFRNTDGLYVSIEDKGHVKEVVDNSPNDEVDIIVVTDGERSLGLGDLGTGGMGIPKGKLALYVACAGVHPRTTLPVVIDVGTNNQNLLKDPLYLGLQQPRVDGAPYYELIDEFILAVKKRWPKVLVQFEDFANKHAFALLHTYQDKINCFNDDIQGTAAVTLSALLSACKAKGSELKDQKILFLGAGEAAIGGAELIVQMMVKQGDTEEDAKRRIYLFDSKGLVVSSRDNLSEAKKQFAHAEAPVSTFLDAVEAIKPTAIIGLSAQEGAFNAYVLGAMARINEKPIIFALSNPTSKAECTAREAYTYTNGRALFACGSPFAPVEVNGKTFVPRQANNSYVFPGIGLGSIYTQAKRLPEGLFLTAAEALSDTVTPEDLEKGSLLPSLLEVRKVSLHIAHRVAEYCYKEGLAQTAKPEDLKKALEEYMYVPVYPKY